MDFPVTDVTNIQHFSTASRLSTKWQAPMPIASVEWLSAKLISSGLLD
jgi:hypothetical protein